MAIPSAAYSVALRGLEYRWEEYRINPAIDDFYKRVIDLRRSVKKQLNKQNEKNAEEREIKRLDSEQMALKILANVTSYGAFIELNVEETDERDDVLKIHTATGSRKAHGAKREESGEFFDPLLGTLITGAARLMLAITERLLIDEGLDWAFCDTDSMAFAVPEGMALGKFEKRVRRIESLNPYEQRGSILEFEDQNFVLDASRRKQLEPLYCAAISAKRYALFNLDSTGEPLIRKASAHGLGHLLPPYSDERNNGEWRSPVARGCLEGDGQMPKDGACPKKILTAANSGAKEFSNPEERFYDEE